MATMTISATADGSKSKRSLGLRLYDFGAVLGLVLMCVTLTFLSPRFLTVDNLLNVAGQAAINSIISVGMLMVIVTAGIDLSVGQILALSIMVMGVLSKNYAVSPYLAILGCLATGTALGFANGLLFTRLNLPHPFISTLGMSYMAKGIALVITGAAPVSGFPAQIQFFGRVDPLPYSIVLVAVLYVGVHLFLTRTTLGRYIYAVGGNREASRLSGINVKNVLTIVYAISGFTAALAGLVLVGRVNSAYPLAGQGYELDAIAAVIIGGASFFGGVGSIGKTIIGVLLIAVLRNGLNLLNVTSSYQLFAIGAVIVVAVYVDVLRQKVMRAA